MVVKWSADKDQFILNHLLTDTSIKINNDVLDAMIQTWRMYSPLSYISFLFLHHTISFSFRACLHYTFLFALHPCTFHTSFQTCVYISSIHNQHSLPNKTLLHSQSDTQFQLPPSVPHPPERP